MTSKSYLPRNRWLYAPLIYLIVSACFPKNHCAEATNSSAAYEFAKEVIASNLKSPSSAVFPQITDDHVFVYQENPVLGANECTFTVVGFVDSQNGFGAMLRSNFRMEALYEHSSKRWSPTSVEFR